LENTRFKIKTNSGEELGITGMAICWTSYLLAACAFNVFIVLAVFLCIAVNFIVSVTTDLQATAAVIADLDALSALSAAWATTNAAAFIFLSALVLTQLKTSLEFKLKTWNISFTL